MQTVGSVDENIYIVDCIHSRLAEGCGTQANHAHDNCNPRERWLETSLIQLFVCFTISTIVLCL